MRRVDGFVENGGRRWLYALAAVAVWLAAAWGPRMALAEESLPNATIPGRTAYLPQVQRAGTRDTINRLLCPTTSDRAYQAIPVDGDAADHPDMDHGDLNLSLRGYVQTSAALTLVNINGPTDDKAPQLAGLFLDTRTPVFTSAHRIYDWKWDCGEHGCRGDQLTRAEVSLLGMATGTGEAIAIPSRDPQIYGGGYKVLVLYAAEDRITLGYTRHDTVAAGYAVHIEKVCVDPNLLALYRAANGNGRRQLPALHNGEVLGTAPGAEILVSIRDRGDFMDPRSRKDWWRGR